MRLLITLLILVSSFLSIINAQGSISSCRYNGINYGNLANSTSYSSTDSNNIYTYYFNICKAASKCNNSAVSACQVKNGAVSINVGMLNLGVFSIVNGETIIKYMTNSNQCKGGQFRNFNIIFKPYGGSVPTISQVVETSTCSYSIYFNFPLHGDSSSSSSHNSTSCQTIGNGIEVSSDSSIVCSGKGPMQCKDNVGGSVCLTQQDGADITCMTDSDGNNSITCTGSSIDCIYNNGQICSTNN